MSAFEVEMELRGFKLRVKGERSDDLPHLTSQVGKQLMGMLPPLAVLEPRPAGVTQITAAEVTPRTRSISRPRIARRRGLSGDSAAPGALAWQHDSRKWGMPSQDWSAIQKIVWIMLVIRAELNERDLGAPLITETFNQKFKEFGPLSRKNTSRDLGRAKREGLVMNDPQQDPVTWFLTDKGAKEAEKLVATAVAGNEHGAA